MHRPIVVTKVFEDRESGPLELNAAFRMPCLAFNKGKFRQSEGIDGLFIDFPGHGQGFLEMVLGGLDVTQPPFVRRSFCSTTSWPHS
jgi:hypothetical protein